jgi:O-antigen/teichoic acid export membrane protein
MMMALAGVLAARALGPSGRGIVTAVTTWPMMLAYLSLLGINSSATLRIAQKNRDGLATTLGTTIVYSFVVGGIVALAAMAVIPAALAHLGPQARGLTIWALSTLPLILLGDILLSINVALGRVQLANWCRLIGPITILAGTLVLIALHEVTPARIVALNLLSGVAPILIGSVELPWRRIAVDLSEMFRDLKFGIKAHLASLLGIANVRLDVLLISAFVSASQVGYYGIANNMMMPVTFGAYAASVILTPKVARMGHPDGHGGIDRAQLDSIWAEVRRFAVLGVAGAVLVAVVAPFAVPLVFGPSFQPVVVLVWVLLPGYVARVYAELLSAGALGGRRPWVGNVSEGAGVVVTLGLLPILLPRYQALGAAITSTIAYSVTALVAVLAIRRLARRSEPSPVPEIGESRPGADQPAPATRALVAPVGE